MIFSSVVLLAVGVLAKSNAPRQATSSPAVNASVPLRIMSLGASVTFGVGSTTGNSYRKNLQDTLVAQGLAVSYVGTRNNGDFADNAVDAGTNNCNAGELVPDAGTRVASMINSIYQQSPGATVVLASILVNRVSAQDACRVDINKQYAALAAALQTTGAKFAFVDMRSPQGPKAEDLFDTRHPNDAGYVKMAGVWAGGIQDVLSKGFITPPIN